MWVGTDTVAGFEKVDDYTVRIDKVAPYVKLFETLAEYGFILPKEYHSQDPDAFDQAPIGSGPYKLVSKEAVSYTHLSMFSSILYQMKPCAKPRPTPSFIRICLSVWLDTAHSLSTCPQRCRKPSLSATLMLNYNLDNQCGYILQEQGFCTHDGNGIRTVIFFMGCPLRCRWCANPEAWTSLPKLAFYHHKCSGCGTCVSVCPQNIDPRGITAARCIPVSYTHLDVYKRQVHNHVRTGTHLNAGVI